MFGWLMWFLEEMLAFVWAVVGVYNLLESYLKAF